MNCRCVQIWRSLGGKESFWNLNFCSRKEGSNIGALHTFYWFNSLAHLSTNNFRDNNTGEGVNSWSDCLEPLIFSHKGKENKTEMFQPLVNVIKKLHEVRTLKDYKGSGYQRKKNCLFNCATFWYHGLSVHLRISSSFRCVSLW